VAEVGSAFVSILPSAKGFGSKLSKQVAPETKKTGTSLGSSLGKAFAIAGGAAAAVGFIKGSIAEAREAQKVGALTASVIKSTGGAANVSAKQVSNLAGAISRKTGIDDETIQSGQNMLLTFKNIRNEAGKGNDIFNQSSKALVDMAAAMDKDPKQAAIGLGKALNDPIKGVTALSRVGVQFTDKQKGVIKSLVETGHTADAQKLILKELNSEFGGAAAAQATAGDKARVAFGNLQETIGTALLPVIDKLANIFTTKVAPAVTKFIGQIQSGKGAGGAFAAVFQRVASVISTVVGFLARSETARTFAAAILAIVAAVRIWSGVQAVLNAELFANPIGLVVLAIAALVTGLVLAYKHSETFRNIVNAAFHGVVAAGKVLWAATRAGIAIVVSSFQNAQRGAKIMLGVLKGAFRAIVNAFLNLVGAIIHGAAKAFGWVPGIGPKLKRAASDFDAFKGRVNRALGGINASHATSEVNRLRAALDGVKDKRVTITTMFVNKGKPAGGGASGLPGQARGTNDFAGGLTWVGERGPEIVNLPRHSQVIPNHKIGHAANGTVDGGVMRVMVVNPGDIAVATDSRADRRVAAHAGVSREAARARR
jgi:hypothetical protein